MVDNMVTDGVVRCRTEPRDLSYDQACCSRGTISAATSGGQAGQRLLRALAHPAGHVPSYCRNAFETTTGLDTQMISEKVASRII
jgi:hypothetical protein